MTTVFTIPPPSPPSSQRATFRPAPVKATLWEQVKGGKIKLCQDDYGGECAVYRLGVKPKGTTDNEAGEPGEVMTFFFFCIPVWIEGNKTSSTFEGISFSIQYTQVSSRVQLKSLHLMHIVDQQTLGTSQKPPAYKNLSLTKSVC